MLFVIDPNHTNVTQNSASTPFMCILTGNRLLNVKYMGDHRCCFGFGFGFFFSQKAHGQKLIPITKLPQNLHSFPHINLV